MITSLSIKIVPPPVGNPAAEVNVIVVSVALNVPPSFKVVATAAVDDLVACISALKLI